MKQTTLFCKKNLFLYIVAFAAALFVYTKNVSAENEEKVSSEKKLDDIVNVINTPETKEEDTVIISIINYGRKNPFKPYSKITVVDKTATNITESIPYPPSFDESIKDQINELMKAQVNGILFDPNARSSAIIQVKGDNYMVHVGDSVYEFEVMDISKEKVTLKLGTNTYSVGVGQIVDGSVHYEPVQRKNKGFGQKTYTLPELEFEEL